MAHQRSPLFSPGVALPRLTDTPRLENEEKKKRFYPRKKNRIAKRRFARIILYPCSTCVCRSLRGNDAYIGSALLFFSIPLLESNHGDACAVPKSGKANDFPENNPG